MVDTTVDPSGSGARRPDGPPPNPSGPNGLGDHDGGESALAGDGGGHDAVADALQQAAASGKPRWADGPQPPQPEPTETLDRRLWRKRKQIVDIEDRLRLLNGEHKSIYGQWQMRERRQAAARDQELGGKVRGALGDAGIDLGQLAELAEAVKLAGGIDGLKKLLGSAPGGDARPATPAPPPPVSPTTPNPSATPAPPIPSTSQPAEAPPRASSAPTAAPEAPPVVPSAQAAPVVPPPAPDPAPPAPRGRGVLGRLRS